MPYVPPPLPVAIANFVKIYYPLIIGFGIGFTALNSVPKTEEARRKSKYAQQLDNYWGKKDPGHGTVHH